LITRPTVKINFSGFWSSLNKTDNFFYNLLSQKYEVVINDEPDLLFFTDVSTDHTKYNCTKIFYTGENKRPDFMLCDFAFCYDYPVTSRNYRLPLYALYEDVNKMVGRNIDARAALNSKTKFCCFLVSNPKCAERNNFFHELSKYKQVDSGGQTFNNIGYLVENKWEFIKDYKFVIAFENASYPGYTTEKIYEPFIKNCVPIYWGNPLVGKDFNTKSFINSNEFSSFDEVIKHVIAVDNDDELYMRYISEPVFTNDEPNEFVKAENIMTRLDEIVAFHFNGKFKFKRKLRPAYFFYLNCTKQLQSFTRAIITRLKNIRKTNIF